MLNDSQKTKVIHSQDAGLKIAPKNSGETSLNLSNEIMEFIVNTIPNKGEEVSVSFILYKDDFLKGLAYIIDNLPLYKSASTSSSKIEFSEKVFMDLLHSIQDFFGAEKTKVYTVNLIRKTDSRIYLNGLRKGSFTLRDFLVEEQSMLLFQKNQNGDNIIRLVDGKDLDKEDNEEAIGEALLNLYNSYRPFITAIKSKPFLLLAGISGTGKSRIVRELARSCWAVDSEEYKDQKPKNFEMIQVKPNWHDSSELIGYVSRIKGEPEYVVGDFLKFIAKAWENWLSEDKKPYFLCLDEMNLAPVEQYFAEYLSVVESRKVDEDGNIVYDPIVKKDTEGFASLIHKLAWEKQELNDMFEAKGICLPPNLIVVGTVNMDETTFSFSRKVLDRAMTIEMNDVDLYGGLTTRYEAIGLQSIETLIGTAVEGVDVYESHQEVCDKCIEYLGKINAQLEGTPFKVAYRTRNEFLLYVVNNLPYTKDADGTERSQEYVIARALDEITNMKVLSRIEGDESKVSADFLGKLKATISEGLTAISSLKYADKAKVSEEEGVANTEKSISLAKLSEMTKKLESGYTSFWS